MLGLKLSCPARLFSLSLSTADVVYRVRLAAPCTMHMSVLRWTEVLLLCCRKRSLTEEGSCCRPTQAPEALTRLVPCLTIKLGATNAEAGQRPTTQGRILVHFIVYLARALNRRREQQTGCGAAVRGNGSRRPSYSRGGPTGGNRGLPSGRRGVSIFVTVERANRHVVGSAKTSPSPLCASLLQYAVPQTLHGRI